jgi:hypothetical protein
MEKHFYKKQKPCPSATGILLTDAIKTHVMTYRQYVLPATPPTQGMQQTINTQNNIIYIQNLTLEDKISLYKDKTKVVFTNYEDKVEKLFLPIVGRLIDTPLDADMFELHYDHFLEIMAKTFKTNNKDFSDVSIYHHPHKDFINMMDNDEWIEMIQSNGIVKALEVVRDNYLKYYEFYLVKMVIKSPSHYRRQKASELLNEYFQFLGVFNVKLGLEGYDDNSIIENNKSDDYVISEKYCNKYNEVKKTIKNSYKQQVRLDIIKILKEHTDEIAMKLGSVLTLPETQLML